MKSLRCHYWAQFLAIIYITLVGVEARGGGLEVNTDRPGLDYSNFDLSAADPTICEKNCNNDPMCKAFTYVKTNTMQGLKPRCWLKTDAPSPVPSNCCISGVMESTSLSIDIDRPGMDYYNNIILADPKSCRDLCIADGHCKAWTYVKPNTTQGPKARCWLKAGVPLSLTNTCCISGVMRVSTNSTKELDTDRLGMDYESFEIKDPDFFSVPPDTRPDLYCKSKCVRDPKCQAWTYVKEGVQGPYARCWLKSGVPSPLKNTCCVSGRVE